jgi:very-short-patch-repair endonuclease
LFDEADLVVEVSGRRGHSSPAERSKDAQRRNELQALGRTVYEFTWEDVTTQPGRVVREVAERLRAASSP